MNNSFAGLDLSQTDSGVACLTEKEMFMHNIQTKPDQFPNSLLRAEFIADNIMEYVSKYKPDFIVVEDYFMGRNPKAIINLCELGTLVRYKLLKGGFPFRTVAPNQLKKFCLGKGNGGKELILKGIYKKWGIDVDNNNIADAVVLAYISKALYYSINEMDIELLKYEIEVVKKVLKERQTIVAI